MTNKYCINVLDLTKVRDNIYLEFMLYPILTKDIINLDKKVIDGFYYLTTLNKDNKQQIESIIEIIKEKLNINLRYKYLK